VQTEEQGAGTDRLAMLVPKKSGLGPVMFEAFKELFKNGEYARIMKKWGLEKVTVPEPSLNPKVDG
jgi:polar amino acid transport system substrate-binding protein